MNRQKSASVAGLDIGVPGCENAIEIGRGGFGVVYLARQPAFSRMVAVKVLAADRLDEASRVRFERELKAMGRLSGHPHIVTVHQAGHTTLDNPYILMAYEDGGSLAAQVAAGAGGASWQDAVAGAIAVAGALETAHRAGVLHRDVKPENILISRYGEPKLADFGLARPVSGTGADKTRSSVTASVLHAAPEILRGEPASVASDVYALASTVFVWLTGTAAFAPDASAPGGAGSGPAPGGTLAEVLDRIATSPVPDLRPRGVPEPVCAALERAMAKDPRARQPTAARFAADLQAAQSSSGLPVTDVVVGGFDAADWRDDGAPAAAPPHRSRLLSLPLSLTARMRAALRLSSTMEHSPRPTRVTTRLLGATLSTVAALAVGGSQHHPVGVPVELATAVDFGDQSLSDEAQQRVVTVRNRGTRTVQVTDVALNGAGEFTVAADRCSARSLAPRNACEVVLAFAPRDPGLRRAALDLAFTGRGQVRSVTVTGEGLRSYASEDDPPPGRCYGGAYQVGQTAYGYVGGLKAISVKQYWSPTCQAAMAYIWIWKQYRDTAGVDGQWTVDVSITGQPGKPERAAGQPLELWTTPTPVPDGCTRATATVAGTGLTRPMTATTAEHCA